MDKKGLKPAPKAPKEMLLRRLYFDLTGLPPSISEIDHFLNDQGDDAYEKVVDRLLQSLSYGERMASIWMDIARYADTKRLSGRYTTFYVALARLGDPCL
jgi:hypothetical protein